jgi:cytochrome c553
MKYLLILLFFTLSLFGQVKGSVLYNSCQYCHGSKAEKTYADVVSEIKNNDYESLKIKLELYKKGELDMYGYGAIMKQQRRTFTRELK